MRIKGFWYTKDIYNLQIIVEKYLPYSEYVYINQSLQCRKILDQQCLTLTLFLFPPKKKGENENEGENCFFQDPIFILL